LPSQHATAPCVDIAAGVLAPGHLGELTRYLPVELVDDVLDQTRTVQRRVRKLPSRVGVYFVLALGLFPQLGYARVWAKLVAGTAGVAVARPSEKALRDLRRRLGPAPLKMLFEVVAGPLAQPRTRGVSFAGMRTVAFDGLNSLKIPDSDRNRSWLGRIYYRVAFAGYPTLRILCLVETGTRGLLGAVIGGGIDTPADRAESVLATRLLDRLTTGMLVLADRAYDSAPLMAALTATGAKLLIRGSATRRPPVLQLLADGSYLSVLAGLPVRIIEAQITVRGADGSTLSEPYRLITTLHDPRRFPATTLTSLYHERWEIETAFLALRHTMLDAHVLRSHDRPGIEQELWALLTVYQLLRTAMVEAIETDPDLDPDRASFTTALQAARDSIITSIITTRATTTELVGLLGRAVLATLLPPRRMRYSNRTVKSPRSRFRTRADDRPRASTTILSIDIAVRAPQITDTHPDPPPRAALPRSTPRHPPRPPRPVEPTRRQLVLDLLTSDTDRSWHGGDLANELGIPRRNLLTQLAEWTRNGFLHRTGTGRYSLPPPANGS
jgi:Insertion element 4 transposase N-terminal/Transposase DDE domain